MRMCVVTREKYPKKELIRVVKNEDVVLIDITGKVNGRGAYLKKDISVVDKAEKTKILEKHLEVAIGSHIYEQLRGIINEER